MYTQLYLSIFEKKKKKMLPRLTNPFFVSYIKAIVWRPLRTEDLKGYDPEATLEMRAARLMDRICKDFCQWLKQLGETEQTIDEDTLKDMFEINFSAMACRATQVSDAFDIAEETTDWMSNTKNACIVLWIVSEIVSYRIAIIQFKRTLSCLFYRARYVLIPELNN